MIADGDPWRRNEQYSNPVGQACHCWKAGETCPCRWENSVPNHLNALTTCSWVLVLQGDILSYLRRMSRVQIRCWLPCLGFFGEGQGAKGQVSSGQHRRTTAAVSLFDLQHFFRQVALPMPLAASAPSAFRDAVRKKMCSGVHLSPFHRQSIHRKVSNQF